MAFLTSRSVSKRILFALGVDPTARDAGEGGGSDLVSQNMPFAVSCARLVAVHVLSLHILVLAYVPCQILLQQFSLGTRPHKSRTDNYVSTLAKNGLAVAGPVGPVPAPMLYGNQVQSYLVM